MERDGIPAKKIALHIALAILVPGLAALGFYSFRTGAAERSREHLVPVGLRLEPDALQVGNVPELGFAKATVKLHNLRAEELTIEDVSADCGCTVANVEPRRILPGGTAEVHIDYSASTGAFGEFEKHVRMKVSSGQKREVLAIAVRGRIIPSSGVSAFPSRLEFGAIGSGGIAERRLHLMTKRRVSEALPDQLNVVPGIPTLVRIPTASSEEGESVQHEIRVTCRAESSRAVGFYGSEIRFVDDQGSTVIPFSATIVGPIRIVPSQALFVVDDLAKSTETTVTLHHVDCDRIDVLDITSDLPIRVDRLEAVSGGKSLRLSYRAGGGQAALLTGTMTLKLEACGKVKDLKVPIVITRFAGATTAAEQ